jgi:ATP diphosphatase
MAANDSAAMADELGDLLFAVVNLSRHLKVDAEAALRQATAKFERRFRFLEQRLREAGLAIEDCSLEQLDVLWGEAKQQEKAAQGC